MYVCVCHFCVHKSLACVERVCVYGREDLSHTQIFNEEPIILEQ